MNNSPYESILSGAAGGFFNCASLRSECRPPLRSGCGTRNIAIIEATVDTSPFAEVMQELQKSLKPYHEGFLSFSRLPEAGCGREEILREMEKLKSVEEARWKEGKVSGAVYHGDSGHVDFLNQVYALNSQSNPLHADVWPSTTKFEAEIVAMTANMLGADADPRHGICGTVTSGGTESILVAMKTYRDWARETKASCAK